MIRRFWMIGLLIVLVVNYGIISYVLLSGAQHIDEVQIRVEPMQQITTQDPLVIRFNTPMQQSTVASAIRLTPPHAFQLQWADDSQQVTLVPDTPWASTTYTISIDTNAQSRTGRYLQQPWQTQMNAQRVVQIRQVLPSANQVDVPRDGMIVIRFSQQMIPQSMVGEVVPSPIQIFPFVEGISTWLDVRTFAFQANEFAPNQEYSVTAPAQLRDVSGAPLQSSYTWRFRTMATRIDRIHPASGSQEVGIQQSVVLTMTGQIDAVRLQQTLAITPTTETQLTTSALTDNQTLITIAPTKGWLSDTLYTLAGGGSGSALAPFSTTFRTVPSLRLVARTPGDGEVVGSDREVRFIFNTLLDTRTISDAITITPAPIQPARITTTGRDIRIAANWEVQVNPIIQISSALQSSNGISLTTPISSELQIDPRQALVTLPGTPGDIYDASTTSTFQLQIIPNRTARLRIYDLPVATLVRMLDMDITTLLNVDPERYNLPLLAQQQLQSDDGRSRITVDIMRDITGTPMSRIWLVQLISANGSQDIRLVRTQPATLHAVSLPQQIAIGVQDTQESPANRTVLVFQSGQLISQGRTDTQGIWQSPYYATNQQLIVIDEQQPTDAYKLPIRAMHHHGALQLVVDRQYTARGDQVTVLLARAQANAVRTAQIRIRYEDGEVINQQPVVFDAGVRISSARMRIPSQILPGLYSIEFILDGDIVTQPLLIYDQFISTLHVSTTDVDGTPHIVVRDQFESAVANQRVYWMSDTQTGTGVTDYRGQLRITHSAHPTVLLVVTENGSAIYHLAPSVAPRRMTLTHDNWVEVNQPSTVDIRLIDDTLSTANRTIQIDAIDERGDVVQQQRINTDSTGRARVQFELPQGSWQLVARSNDIQATTTIWVGTNQANSVFAAQTDTLTRGQVARWRNDQSAAEQFLVAHYINQQLQVAWQQSSATGVIESQPITQTGSLYTVIGPAGTPYHHSIQPVRDPLCPEDSPIYARAANQKIDVQIMYAPNSRILFNIFDASRHQLLAENVNMVSDETGLMTFQLADNGITNAIYVSLMGTNDTCYIATTQHIPVDRVQLLTIDAPEVVRIGDIIGVRLSVRDTQPYQFSRLRVIPDGLQMIDTLPQYSVTSDKNGEGHIIWRYRVNGPQVRLMVESLQSPAITWQPRLISKPIIYSNDGFVLRGTTSFEQAGDSPLMLDIITTPQQLQQALNKSPIDDASASHIAHQLWHTISPTDQLILQQQLRNLRLSNGAWGWVGSQIADPLITADVVIALTLAKQPMTDHQGAIRYLQQQIQNPQLLPSIRAIVGYALALNQQIPVDALVSLSRAPHLLGNEGLAALLLSIPSEYAYTSPPVLAELLQRAQSAPRGVWWQPDSATASLHSRESVNALIYQALSTLNVASDIRTQLGSQLLSMRGTNGWSDSIANARIWSQHTTLIPELSANAAIIIRNDIGQTTHTGTMSPAQAVSQTGTLETSGDVLVGIARPRNTPAPTGEAAIWLQLYDQNGKRLDESSTLTLGDEITVRVSTAFFSSIPHVTIHDPQSTLSTITKPPVTTLTLSTRIDGSTLTLRTSIDTPKIIQYHYRIRLTHLGRSLLDPIEVRDGSGTLHAQSHAVMVSVVAP